METSTSPCIHCGFCLPACPTYALLGTELDSPRGRLVLMQGLADGSLDATPSVVRHLDLCLGCRACETACPSGVPYGEHLEQARSRLRTHPARDPGHRRSERFALWAVGLPALVQRLGGALLGLLSASGLAGLAASLLPGRAGAAAGLLASTRPRPARLPASLAPTRARADGRRPRVGLLTGCVGGAVLGEVTESAARLLAAAGCEVVVPAGQVCCGALHAHAGDERGAARLLAANLDAFEAAGPLDAVAVTAAGCGSALKEGARRFPGDPTLAARAQAFADGVRDTLELLDELGLPDGGRGAAERVACLDACHLAHAQRLPGLGGRVLSQVPGLELVPLATSDRCCGSAGIYNLLHPEEAAALGDERLAQVAEAGAEVLATANAGCLMHLSARARATGSKLRCEHPLSLLDQALERAQ